jgi:cysteine desulfurase
LSSIIWTSGATESTHLAVLGSLKRTDRARPHIISSTIEHKATLGALELAKGLGCRVTLVRPDRHGRISSEEVLKAVEPDTFLVSLIHAHNELGTILDPALLGPALAKQGVLFHLDAAQSAGKVVLEAERWAIDLLSLSGHKFGGPKGAGALFINPRISRLISPVSLGGGQEFGLRPGTVNVPGVVGMGAAAEWCQKIGLKRAEPIRRLRNLLNERVREVAATTPWRGRVHINGPPCDAPDRLPNHLSLTIEGLDPIQVQLALQDVAYTSASACSGSSASHVMPEIWRDRCLAEPSVTLRFGLSWDTTEGEVEWVAKRLADLLRCSQPVDFNEKFINP